MTAAKISPRDRLLNAADDLFFKEGIRAVGINRVLQEAQTPIMTLYRNFGSKDGLVAAYLERRGTRNAEEAASELERRASLPREKMLALFDIIVEGLEKGEFRGCPFINAAVEMASQEHEITKIARHYKDAGRQWFAAFAAEAGVPDPEGLAIQLTVLLDGAAAAAAVYHDSSGATYARSAAEALVDAAMAAASSDDDVRHPRKQTGSEQELVAGHS